MNDTLRTVLEAMAMGRVAIGLAPFIAAGRLSRLLGFPEDHDNPTSRLMARFFGIRDVGLGVLIQYGVRHPELLPFLVVFNACMDGGDLLSIAIPLVRRQGIDRAGWRSSMFAATGGLGWLAVWFWAL
jgi:hypothetical protein